MLPAMFAAGRLPPYMGTAKDMKHITLICIVIFFLLLPLAVLSAGEEAKKTGGQKAAPTLAVFAFQSKFDDNKFGDKITYMVRSKIRKKKLFMQLDDYSFADLLAVCPIEVGPDTPVDEVATAAKEYLFSEYVIWGKVDSAGGGHYLLTVYWMHVPKEGEPQKKEKVYDTREAPPPEDPVMDAQDPKFYLASSVQDFVNEFHKITNVEPDYEKLYARNWKTAKNLVKDSSFDKSLSFPSTWLKMLDVIAFDPGPMINVVKDPDPEREGNCIKFELNEYVAANNGLLCYSNWFDIEEYATYRASYDVKSLAPTVKIFVKCYDKIGGQWREIYRKPYNCRPKKDEDGNPIQGWQTYVATFTPWHHKYSPKRARVMLYAYWPKGTVYYDNIILKKVRDVDKSLQKAKMDKGKDVIFYRDVDDEKLKEKDYESYKKQ